MFTLQNIESVPGYLEISQDPAEAVFSLHAGGAKPAEAFAFVEVAKSIRIISEYAGPIALVITDGNVYHADFASVKDSMQDELDLGMECPLGMGKNPVGRPTITNEQRNAIYALDALRVYSRKEIADTVGVGVSTVRSYLLKRED